MSSEAWVGVLAILVGVLSMAIGALLVFLHNQSLKINTLENRLSSLRHEFNGHKEGIAELREYLFRRKRKQAQEGKPDSDEGGESEHQDW